MKTIKNWFTNKRVKDLEREVESLREIVGRSPFKRFSMLDGLFLSSWLGLPDDKKDVKSPTLIERIEGIEKHLGITFEAKTEEVRGYVAVKKPKKSKK